MTNNTCGVLALPLDDKTLSFRAAVSSFAPFELSLMTRHGCTVLPNVGSNKWFGMAEAMQANVSCESAVFDFQTSLVNETDLLLYQISFPA